MFLAYGSAFLSTSARGLDLLDLSSSNKNLFRLNVIYHYSDKGVKVFRVNY